MEKRSRRRIRDLENLLASQGLFENESGCARISIMAKSTKALLTGRIQKCKTNPSIAHIGLATHGLRACARARKGRLNARRKYFLSTNLVKSDTLSACPNEFWLVKACMMFAL